MMNNVRDIYTLLDRRFAPYCFVLKHCIPDYVGIDWYFI